MFKTVLDISDLTNCEDQVLVKLAQQGEMGAFSILYERYLPVVYNRVRYVVPEQDIEDVTQEIFIAVIKSLKSFRQEAKFSTWLRTITNRSVADYYRRRERKKSNLQVDADIGEINPGLGLSYSMTNTATNIHDRVLLRQALKSLPEHYCEVILLRFAEGLQFNEIAEERGQSLEATKSLFRRAIASLREQLEDFND